MNNKFKNIHTLKNNNTFKKNIELTNYGNSNQYDNFNDLTNQQQIGGKNRAKKFFKKLFRTKKQIIVVDGKPIRVGEDEKRDYSFKKGSRSKYSTPSKREVSKKKRETTEEKRVNVEDFIKYILNYNINSPLSLNDNNRHIARNINDYNDIYYSILKSRKSDRRYKLLPSVKYMKVLYDLSSNLSLFFTKLYEYVCINAIFENIIYNAIYSNISNSFNVDNDDYVKYGLSIYSKDKVEEYVSEHNPIFEKIYKCKIDLNGLKFKNLKPVTKKDDIAIKSDVKKPSDNAPLFPINNEFYNMLMSVPGVDIPGNDIYAILGKKPPQPTTDEDKGDLSDSMTKFYTKSNSGKSGDSSSNINDLYLEVINSKIIKSSSSLEEKVKAFYANNYNTISW